MLDRIESKKFYIENNGVKITVDQYDFMGTYLQYLKNKRKKDGKKLAASTVNGFITTAKTFIETETEIAFKTMKYNNKVKPPKIIKNTKIPLARETILRLINGCTQPHQARLKMIILLLSACCSRIGESLLLRLSDLHLDGLPHFGTQPPYYPYIYFRGEITKTGQDRITLLTHEMASQLQLWIDDKYRVRNRVTRDTNGVYRTVDYTPDVKPNDFLFLNINSNYDGKDAATFIYSHILQQFHDLLDNLKLTQRSANGQYAITPHKIRMGVRTAISPLVTDKWFPDFYMGHDTKTYYNPTPEQYKEQFNMCQSALTYLDQTTIIKSYGNLETRVNSIEENQLATLKKQLAQMEQNWKEDKIKMEKERKEDIERLLSVISKESIYGTPAIPKSDIDLIRRGDLSAIPLDVSNRKGEDVKHYTIHKDIESIKNNPLKGSKKLKSKPVPSDMSKLIILEDPAAPFKLKRRK